MVNKIRMQLALWFVSMVMLLYAAGGGASLVVFKAGLTRSADVSLEDLIAEIRPSVEFVDERPSLKSWSHRATEKGSMILATVQIFDREAHLVEQYGPRGITRLAHGTLDRSHHPELGKVRSMYVELTRLGAPHGYLQLQISTQPQDEAIEQFAMAVLAIAPFVAIGVGICAYLFSGKAVRPIERTNLLLRRFVADAGHELGTPVATIEACVQTLEDPTKVGDMAEQVFDMLERASERLKHLAKDLVVLARVEDPETEMVRTTVDLRELAESVVAELAQTALNKEISLELEPLPEASIQAHEESMHEIFNNLIDNAIKYTDRGGRVTVRGERRDQLFILSVSDTGIGIPKDSIPLVFDRFYRVEKSRTRGSGGSGLGLAIVKAAIDRHGGEVKVSSDEGKGSTFTVSLPL